MELTGGAREVGPSCTAGQAKPPTEHGDVRFALQWTGLHQQAAAGRVSYLPHARWQMAAALVTAGGRLVGGPKGPRAIYHQSASLHAQTDRGIGIYERNEPRNKSEGLGGYVLRLKSLFVWFPFIGVRIRS